VFLYSGGGGVEPSLFIKRSGDPEAVFAEIEIFADDNISRLADRASLKFHWNVSADKIKLYLVPVELSDDVADGKSGCEALVLSNPPLSSIKNLSAVGISNGSCLLARVTEVSAPMAISPSESLLAEAIEQLPRRVALALAELENDRGSNVSVLSDPQYEEDARKWLPSQLLQRCGLVVVENFNAQRTYLMELQWDFRAPVIIAQTEPNPNLELNAFEIFPTGTPYYLRPKAIPPCYITPTKSIGSDNPPSAQFFALFEFTTASGWSKRSRRNGDGAFKTMAARLNERLAKTLDRAKEEKLIDGDARITDLVSVIGVVAPTSCNESMSMMMNKKDNVPLLLKEMMDAKRFVVFVKPNVAPHKSRSSNKSSPLPDSIVDS